jgi:flagellar biosynthetic protein FlhB
MDFNSFFMIAGLLFVVTIWGERFVRQSLRLEQAVFEQAPVFSYDIPRMVGWFGELMVQGAFLLAPFFVMAVIVSIIANMLQTGPIFTFFPLKPDVKRINPVQGFKRVFSLRMLFEAFKSIIKLALLGAVAYIMIMSLLPKLFGMMHSDPHAHPWMLMDHASALIFKLAMVLLIIMLLDVAYVRWDYRKKMRMSRRELKEEVKRREGDPHVRAKQRELQREAAKRSRSLSRVPEADVLITNPTHLAIALRYEREATRAPRVIAKGAGTIAEQMKALAWRQSIPVVEQKSLAQRLFREVDIDEAIPESLYEPVALIYAEIMAGQTKETVVEVHA